MTKVSYEITNGIATFKTVSYTEAQHWKDKGWKVSVKHTDLGEKGELKDSLGVL